MLEKPLSQAEVDALLKGIGNEQEEVSEEVDPSSIRPYNLATHERIVRGRMPTLELITERFTRLFRINLYNLLQRSAEVSAGPVRAIKYSEFLRNLVVPTNLNLVQIKPMHGTALVVIDPQLVFLIVDNFFGGDGRIRTRVEGREFTLTEQRIIQRVLNVVFESYENSWESVYPIEFSFVRSEVNTQFANIATPNEVVIVTSFDVDIGTKGGQIHLCLPYGMIEPIRNLLNSSTQGESLKRDGRWGQHLKEKIQVAEVELAANLCSISTTMGKLLNIKVGDIIPAVMPNIIEIKVDGVPIMKCSYGELKGQYALRVESLIDDPNRNFEGEQNE